tara:strand:+ start:655 stop:939 length:285 start_codon:yes stop_codon:yes gene_type:complete
MHYAVNSGLIAGNPIVKISDVFESPTKQHMATLKPEQLPDLMRAVANASIKRTTRCSMNKALTLISSSQPYLMWISTGCAESTIEPSTLSNAAH